MKDWSTITCSILIILACGALHGQGHQFIDGSEQAGLHALNGGRGVIVGDYDNDGFEDAFIAGAGESNMLLKNMGDGTFQNVIVGSGIQLQAFTYCGIWADIDNDGDLDLFLGNFSYLSNVQSNRLYLNNGNGQFTDITLLSGIGSFEPTSTVMAADVDNDGYTDFYLCNVNTQNILWRNNGDNTFTDVTLASGALDVLVAMGAIFFDYDNDGDQDLYLTHDADQANILYRNNGDGTFMDVSESSGLGLAAQGMGVDCADINNDGWLDVYVTNLGSNFLFINNQDGTFNQVVSQSGADNLGMGWACFFLDYDNDTDQDIYVVNQHGFTPVTNALYQNNGLGMFSDVSAGTILASTTNGIGGTWFDMNKDGHLDMLIGNISGSEVDLFMNQATQGNYISFQVSGTRSARDAYGTRITCYVNGQPYISEKKSASSYASQSSHSIHFGLGSAEGVDSVLIHYPSGVYNSLGPLPAGHEYTLVEDSVQTQISCIPTFDFMVEPVGAGEFEFIASGDSDITEWVFDFGDGNQVAGPQVNHLFDSIGTYEVCLTASNSCATMSTCQTIMVDCVSPQAVFEYSTSLYSLSLTSLSSEVDSVYWSFGDGESSSELNPVHTYQQEGDYQLCLMVFNACGMDLICDSIEISCPTPLPDYVVETDGLVHYFTDNSLDVDSVYWTFGDGQTSAETMIEHVYAQEGTYEVCLETYNACGSSTICDSIWVDDLIDALHFETLSTLHVYPNPVRSTLFVQLEEGKKPEITLIDLSGRKHHSEAIVFAVGLVSIDVARFESGVYMLRIDLSEEKTFYQKILIE